MGSTSVHSEVQPPCDAGVCAPGRALSGLHRASTRPPGRRIYAETVAARRLIIVMLALLVLSSVAAALVPIDREALRDTSTSDHLGVRRARRGS